MVVSFWPGSLKFGLFDKFIRIAIKLEKQDGGKILNLVNGYLEKGEGSKARYLMTLTTGLGIKEKKDVVQGLRKLKVEDITKTDLTDINKFGCSFGAAAVLLVSFSIIYNLVF